jgi:type II pantothenate kinase
MSASERVLANIDVEDTFAIADGDAPGRPPRAPPLPASVKINVEGAFIVDDETNGRNGAGSEFVHWEHKDIRLPHHTDVVSHVAVDVRLCPIIAIDLLTRF